jgi:hypothetical protein
VGKKAPKVIESSDDIDTVSTVNLTLRALKWRLKTTV